LLGVFEAMGFRLFFVSVGWRHGEGLRLDAFAFAGGIVPYPCGRVKVLAGATWESR
jgi:hypothetical protein